MRTETAWLHQQGTVVLALSNKIVTGTGTLFLTNNIRPSDIFHANGYAVPIASVESETQITLAFPFPVPVLAGTLYAILRNPGDSVDAAAWVRELLGRYPDPANLAETVTAGGANPLVVLNETDAPANNRRHELTSLSGVLTARFMTDNLATAIPWLQVARSPLAATLLADTTVAKASPRLQAWHNTGNQAQITLQADADAGALQHKLRGIERGLWGCNQVFPFYIAVTNAAGVSQGTPLYLDYSGNLVVSGLVYSRGVTVAPTPTTSATIGQWTVLSAAVGYNLTLPPGGTWAYFIFSSTMGGWNAAIAAGGTVVGSPISPNYWIGFAWRLA